MKKRKLTKLEKFGLIAAVVTGMLFFYLSHVYDPQQASLERAREEYNRTVRQYNDLPAVGSLFQLRRTVEAKENERAEWEQKLKDLDIRFGAPDELVRVRLWITREAEARAMLVRSILPAGKEKDLFQWHIYRVVLEGSFGDFVGFLRTLDEYPMPIAARRIEISGDSEGWPLAITLELLVVGQE